MRGVSDFGLKVWLRRGIRAVNVGGVFNPAAVRNGLEWGEKYANRGSGDAIRYHAETRLRR